MQEFVKASGAVDACACILRPFVDVRHELFEFSDSIFSNNVILIRIADIVKDCRHLYYVLYTYIVQTE